jgi:hypothetical protein
MNPLFRIRTLGALLTLCLAPACFPLDTERFDKARSAAPLQRS